MHLLVLVRLPDFEFQSACVPIAIEDSSALYALPAMPNGRKKPVAVMTFSTSSAFPLTMLFHHVPMKPQYRRKKNRVVGLKGMLLRGPSG